MTADTLQEALAFIPRFIDWCERHGRAPSTVCNRALGNTYGVRVLERRIQRSIEDIERLERFMAQHEEDASRSSCSGDSSTLQVDKGDSGRAGP